MTTEGAGGLSTANLEAILDALDDEEPIGLWQFEETARAELAALLAAAERAGALAVALVELRESAVQLGAAQEPLDFALERTALARWRAALTTCYRLAAGADAGPGAAGARDEASGVAIKVYRNCYDQLQVVTRRNERLEGAVAAARAYLAYIGYRYDGRGTFIPPRELAALADALVALDALRAGGVGETDKEG